MSPTFYKIKNRMRHILSDTIVLKRKEEKNENISFKLWKFLFKISIN